MKKKVFIALLIILIVIIILGFMRSGNFKETETAVIVKVYEKSLGVMLSGGSLYNVSFSNEGNIGFKKGQEILIYFDGMLLQSYPGQIHNVGKIKIIKEKSDIQISEIALRHYYSSRDNVEVSILKLTSDGISLIINDTNIYRYGYSDNYTIYKKVKNKDYTGIGYKIGKDTENSISGYTRDRTRIYMERSR